LRLYLATILQRWGFTSLRDREEPNSPNCQRAAQGTNAQKVERSS
jgi:hypothetical protein